MMVSPVSPVHMSTLLSRGDDPVLEWDGIVLLRIWLMSSEDGESSLINIRFLGTLQLISNTFLVANSNSSKFRSSSVSKTRHHLQLILCTFIQSINIFVYINFPKRIQIFESFSNISFRILRISTLTVFFLLSKVQPGNRDSINFQFRWHGENFR